jgi:hypothetical protein
MNVTFSCSSGFSFATASISGSLSMQVILASGLSFLIRLVRKPVPLPSSRISISRFFLSFFLSVSLGIDSGTNSGTDSGVDSGINSITV